MLRIFYICKMCGHECAYAQLYPYSDHRVMRKKIIVSMKIFQAMYRNTKSILLYILFKIYMTYDSTENYTNWMMYSSGQTMPLSVVSRI